MNKAVIVAFAAALFLSSCDRAAEQPPLSGANIGGPFILTDQDGRQRSNSEFDGNYRLVYFGYTFCPDVCPLDMQNIAKGLREFEKTDAGRARKVQPIFITIDPARDTPAVIKQFVSAFHPRFVGLTGTPEQIAAVAKQYAVFYKAQEPATKGGGYLVDHARQATLFDPQGKPMALISQDRDAGHIAAELDHWVR